MTYPYPPPDPERRPDPKRPSEPHAEPPVPGADWEHGWLAERLFDQRIVLLHGRLDLEAATALSAQLLTLAALGDDVIRLQIDSADGDLHPAMSVMDTLDLLGVPVHAVASGQVGGPAVGVLAAASRRLAAPHASLRLAEPRLEVEGTADEIDARSTELHHLLDAFYSRLSQVTGRTAAALRGDAQIGRFLTAEEALAYGLIDEIANPGAGRAESRG